MLEEVMPRANNSYTTYLERVEQLIPTKVVGGHLAIQGLVYNQITMRDIAIEISAGVFLISLFFYLRHVGATWQRIALTMGSFVAWVLAVSLPVHQRLGIDPLWGSIILILWSAVTGLLDLDDMAASGGTQEG
jgi:hypothetical protein